MNDQQAYEVLQSNLDRLSPRSRNFALDLMRAHDNWGCSEKQSHWLRKLAGQADGSAPADTTDRPSLDVGGQRIVEYFDRASEAGLKYPKMKLSADGEPLVLSRAGERSRFPGAINVTDGGPFGDNVWYGRIERDGTFTLSAKANEAVVKVLRSLAGDPAKVAALYGQRTGNCCFCRRDLEDYRSVSVGYGPICAEKWGLPWGEVEGNPSEYRESA